MSRVIDRVVRAMQDRGLLTFTNEDARAAIAAMREPTAAMLNAYSDAVADNLSDERKWQAMIDRALK